MAQHQLFGLAGNEAALRGGLQGSLGILNQVASPGISALNLQAQQSGALGPQQQQQAFTNFQSSPGQQFLRDQGEQALVRNASAVGGLGGGRVLQELQRQGIGVAAQDFSNQFNRLGQVASPGINALGQGAGNVFNTGGALGAARGRAGEQIANSVGGTTSALAQLINQQGGALSSLAGGTGTSLANLLAQGGQQDAESLRGLAALLGNIAVGSGSNVGGFQAIPQIGQEKGNLTGIGNLLSGGANLFKAFR